MAHVTLDVYTHRVECAPSMVQPVCECVWCVGVWLLGSNAVYYLTNQARGSKNERLWGLRSTLGRRSGGPGGLAFRMRIQKGSATTGTNTFEHACAHCDVHNVCALQVIQEHGLAADPGAAKRRNGGLPLHDEREVGDGGETA